MVPLILDLLKGVTESGSGIRLRSNWTSGGKVVTGFPYKFENPIAGKTGTAQRPSPNGGYEGYVSGFIGFPQNVDKKFVLLVYFLASLITLGISKLSMT